MANKDRQKRSARKARAEERARVEAAQAASAPVDTASDKEKAKKAKAQQKAAKAEEKAKADKNKKPGFFKRIKNYLSDVKSEMSRVTWPSRDELKSYSVAVLVMLVVSGVILWLVDTGVVAIIAAFTGLRG